MSPCGSPWLHPMGWGGGICRSANQAILDDAIEICWSIQSMIPNFGTAGMMASHRKKKMQSFVIVCHLEQFQRGNMYSSEVGETLTAQSCSIWYIFASIYISTFTLTLPNRANKVVQSNTKQHPLCEPLGYLTFLRADLDNAVTHIGPKWKMCEEERDRQ